METGNKSSLVQKIIALTLALSLPANALAATLVVRWKPADTACQPLVQSFLEELRSVASDHTIVAEPMAGESPGTQNTLALACSGEETLEVTATLASKESVKYLFRYISSAKALESADWLPFQDQYLSALREDPAPAALTLQDLGTQQKFSAVEKDQTPQELANTEAAATQATADASDGKSKTVFQKWWFWSIVAAAVGSSTYMLARSNAQPSGATIQVR